MRLTGSPEAPVSDSQASMATAGGAMKIARVGSSFSGNGCSWVSTRCMRRGSRATQKTRPTPNENQPSSTDPTAGAANGVTTLPTTGMNHAGVT